MNKRSDEFSAEAQLAPELGKMSEMSRRRFLALASASAAFAATSCSNFRDEGKAVPYHDKPEEVLPGVPNWYASTIVSAGRSHGVLIKTREGRPIKIDGNPEHPIGGKSTSLEVQAEIMSLYDPERLKAPSNAHGKTLSWKDVDKKIRLTLAESEKENLEIAWILPEVLSPSLRRMLHKLQKKWPHLKLYSGSPDTDASIVSAWKKCYGENPLPGVNWSLAERIVSLEYDLLGTEGDVALQTREFAARRDAELASKAVRLYSLEGGMSLTGMNADYRMRVRSDKILDLVLCLTNEIVLVRGAAGNALDTQLQTVLAPFTLSKISALHHLDRTFLDRLLKDLLAHKKTSIVLAGTHLPEDVHVAVNFLNEVLGARALASGVRQAPLLVRSSHDEMLALANTAKSGKLGLVLVGNCNPLQTWPASAEIAQVLKSARLSVALGERIDESAAACTLLLPAHHTLESWGDAADYAGVCSFAQPVVAPLYSSRQTEGALLSWFQGIDYSEKIWRDFVKQTFAEEVYGKLGTLANLERSWSSALHDGVVKLPFSATSATNSCNMDAVYALKHDPVPGRGLALRLRPGLVLGNGKLAHVGWLQETPHPVSKITWDNVAMMSLTTAKKLGVVTYLQAGQFGHDMIEVKVGGRSLEIPAFVQPGMADDMVEIELGFGRTRAGTVGTRVGFDAMKLASNDGLAPMLYEGAELRKLGRKYDLVSTQEHHALDIEDMPSSFLESITGATALKELVHEAHLKRGVVKEGSYEEYERNPKFLHHETPPDHSSMDRPHKYDGVKWAMAIDLSRCTGCSQCVMSCNAENNIPVVGKDQVRVGREMHWMRIDRYYSGTANEPVVSQQPMLCSHCDNAPCENVCPVVATTHSPEGINEMTYNRCVGTRYCANNCPTKVRRFNFFDFRDYAVDGVQKKPSMSLLHNPEVTVRSRGVMEKCSFCVQRVNAARAASKRDGSDWKGQGMTTACQDSCPADAIVFGNVNDPTSDIYRYSKHGLGYTILEETAIQSNVHYLARLRQIEEIHQTGGEAHS